MIGDSLALEVAMSKAPAQKKTKSRSASPKSTDIVGGLVDSFVKDAATPNLPRAKGVSEHNIVLLLMKKILSSVDTRMDVFNTISRDKSRPLFLAAEGRVFLFFADVVGPVLACFWGLPSTAMLVGSFIVWYVQMTGVLVGYHRFFAHRSFECGAGTRLMLSIMGAVSGQRGPIWWAMQHRYHHRVCEEDWDPSSPQAFGPCDTWYGKIRGFVWSQGLYLAVDGPVLEEANYVKDLLGFRESVFIDSIALWIFYGYGIFTYLAFGMLGNIWLFWIPLSGSWNCVQMVNSAVHMVGHRKYRCALSPKCDSRNIWWLTPFLLGENWHNNHHAFATSARQGFHWYQPDPNYYMILFLEQLGLVWNVRKPNFSFLEKWGNMDLVNNPECNHSHCHSHVGSPEHDHQAPS